VEIVVGAVADRHRRAHRGRPRHGRRGFRLRLAGQRQQALRLATHRVGPTRGRAARPAARAPVPATRCTIARCVRLLRRRRQQPAVPRVGELVLHGEDGSTQSASITSMMTPANAERARFTLSSSLEIAVVVAMQMAMPPPKPISPLIVVPVSIQQAASGRFWYLGVDRPAAWKGEPNRGNHLDHRCDLPGIDQHQNQWEQGHEECTWRAGSRLSVA